MIAIPLLLSCVAAAPVQKADAPRESFEEFLARVKAQRDQQQQKLAALVREHVAALEPEKNARPESAERALNELVALGSEATPLLVPYLDPGAAASDKDHARAARIAVALTRMDTSPVVDSLLRALTGNSEEFKRNALRALEGAKDREHVRPRVKEFFAGAQGAVRQCALRTLFALGGANDQELITQVLLGEDKELTRLALAALADAKNPSVLDKLDPLLADAKKCGPVIPDVLAYLISVSESVRESELKLLAQLAANSTEIDADKRIAVLDALPNLTTKLSNEVRKALETLLGQARDRKVRESALVALVCLGEKSARKELLVEFDDHIKKSDRWAPYYTDRAEVLYRIRDYDSAIKDFNSAMTLSKLDPQPHPEISIGLARCYAMQGKLKEASECIEKAPISYDELAKLAVDPVFAKLAAHPKFGSVFKQK